MALESHPRPVEFRLDAGPTTRALLRFVLVLALIGHGINSAIYLTGNGDGEGALAVGLFLVLGPAGFAINMWLMSRGVVLLKADELEVRTRGGRLLYGWDDIADIQALTYRDLGFTDRLWARLTGLNQDVWLVKVALRRPVRLAWFPGRFGTKPSGIPVPGMKTVYIYVSDPAGFVQAASAFLVTR